MDHGWQVRTKLEQSKKKATIMRPAQVESRTRQCYAGGKRWRLLVECHFLLFFLKLSNVAGWHVQIAARRRFKNFESNKGHDALRLASPLDPIVTTFVPCRGNVRAFRKPETHNGFTSSALGLLVSSNTEDEYVSPVDTVPDAYRGQALAAEAEIMEGISLAELGLDLCVAPSTVAPSGLGIFVKVSQDSSVEGERIEQVTLPAMTLLCGYSREGSYQTEDIGDKTVGFLLNSPNTAVFFNRQLMSIFDALTMAGSSTDDEGDADVKLSEIRLCGLAGHSIQAVEDEGGLDGSGMIRIDAVEDGFPRYFVPAGVNPQYQIEQEDEVMQYSVQNFGQFGNDLAWDFINPPKSKEDYIARSREKNMLQLVWRMEYDSAQQCLVPSWPVTVVNQDVTFGNKDHFMELGTQYGWKYWQATVQVEEL
jgi:hypothetical protein